MKLAAFVVALLVSLAMWAIIFFAMAEIIIWSRSW